MILRRFPEGVMIPIDLNDLQNIKPISVVIGWVKEGDDILDFSSYKKGVELLKKYKVEIS